MSNVKLVTLKSKLPKFALDYINVLDAYKLSQDQICRKIFNNYDKLYIVLTPITTLPVPDYVNHPEIRKCIDEAKFREFLLKNSNTRFAGLGDNPERYDVYKLWWMAKSLPVIKVPIDKIMMKNYGTTVLDDISNVWGYKYTELPADEIKRIHQVNLKYPILINGAYKSIDGHHRILKCKISGCIHIAAIKIPQRILVRALIHDWISAAEYGKRFRK
jgi:hypothetical protein